MSVRNSYRSFNRALGETSLEIKCLFLFGLCLAVVITASFLMYWQVTKNLADAQNPNTGRLLADQALMIYHFEVFSQGSDFLYVVQDWKEKLNQQEFQWRVILPNEAAGPTGATAPARDDDSQFVHRLLREWLTPSEDDSEADGPDYAERLIDDGEVYQYYQAVRAQSSCLSLCHKAVVATPGQVFDPAETLALGGTPESLVEGDLMAILEVSIPNGPTQDTVSWYWNALLAVAIITAFLAMVAFYVTIRYVIVRPVRHLREVSDAISHGNIAMRADIHTGDEFEALAVAFNRMLRHLVTIQDELRRANTKLDGKVDELAQVNMQLYEMNRIKSDFMATMSHELRTPLNSILGFSDVLRSADSLDEKQRRYVKNIQKSGQMLLDMINNILDLAKIESGKMDPQPTDFSIGQLIGTQCDMARPLAEKKNIDLDADIPPDLPPIHQDQGRVHQVLNNLLSNAIKFTPEGGRIQVVARQDDRGRLVLKVIDTGVGIAEEDQQVIFEKFRQGRTAMPGGDAMTREYSGTGLGLSIVKELCKLLGGEVSVESVLGTGSTFTVVLPWKLERQPRLDSPLTLGFEELARPRFDVRLDSVPAAGDESRE
jgi:signal transduction histidine kinase